MKRFFTVLLLILLLSGCGEQPDPESIVLETIPAQTVPAATALEETPALHPVFVRLEETEAEAAVLYDTLINDPNLTQADMNDLSHRIYMLWDDLLNEIWQQLKDSRSEEEMAPLTQAQRDWITEKEAAIHRAAATYSGGSLAGSSTSQQGAALTRQRVYFLAEILTGQPLAPAEAYDSLYPATTVTPLIQALFRPLAEGWHILDYDAFLRSAQELQLSVHEAEGLFEVADPDAPGSYLFGSLTTETGVFRIAQLGYCRVTDSGERRVRVDFEEDSQSYFISAAFWDDGTQVDTLQEMMTYLFQ